MVLGNKGQIFIGELTLIRELGHSEKTNNF